MVLILNSIIDLLNFVPKIPFFGKYRPEYSDCFVLTESQYERIIRGADSDLIIAFLIPFPRYLFWANLVPKVQIAKELLILHTIINRLNAPLWHDRVHR